MRSQARFFMDAADERAFIEAVVEEPSTVLVDGPDWDGRQAPLVSLSRLPADAWYLLIWNQVEVPRLKTKRSGDRWEVCHENETIQFLRSRLWDGTILTEGRIAIATTTGGQAVERRYRRLREFIRRGYRNEVVCWTNPQLAQSARSEPDQSVWVGPGALQWLRGSADHKFKHDRHGATEAVVHDGNADELLD